MNFWPKLFLVWKLFILQVSHKLRASKCQTSVSGIGLADHTFLTLQDKNIHTCYMACSRYKACQSINFMRSRDMCQLNNRSITTKPNKKLVMAELVYFEHPKPTAVGSDKESPAESCMEIKRTRSSVHSGLYWLKHPLTSNISQVYCNMQTGVADGCFSSPCQNQGTCTNTKHGDYNCTCTAAYKGANCEMPASDACKSSPCQNGGTCSNTGINDYSCACAAGYTGKSCDGFVSGAECVAYTNNTDADRSINQPIISRKCDNTLVTKWYRFTGPAGTRLPTTAPPKSKCNTDATGWLNGAHPSVAEGVVSRTVCFHWGSSTCKWSVVIRVRNCGSYYVYELKKPLNCHLRYCVTM